MKKMNKLAKSLAAMAVAATVCVPASAQTEGTRNYETFPHWYVGLQGGVQSTINDYKFGKLITPIGAVSLGYNFTPVLGARVGVTGWQCKGGHNAINATYDYKYVTGNIDVLFNLSNLITGRDYSCFNFILLGGVGYNHSWDYQLPQNVPSVQFCDMSSSNSRNFRLGMQLNFDVCKVVDLNLEAGVNNLNDNFNGVINHKTDWQPYAMAGIAFKFGRKKPAKEEPVVIEPVVVEEPVKEEPVVVEPAPVVETPAQKVEEPKAPAVVKDESTLYFALGKSSLSKEEAYKLDQVVEFLNKNPQAKIRLTGYADRGTGTPEINKRLADERVKYVQDMLVKRGINASRIITDSKGDTVQPFADNDRNRVVLGIAE